jgi:23S rRNA (guanosine2251-2'-O)-methyltransferase
MSRNEERKRFRAARTDQSARQHEADDASSETLNLSSGVRGKLFGLSPVMEALRAGTRPIEHITIAEGVQDHRLRELLELARGASVPVRRAPRSSFARMVGSGANHQGVFANVASARFTDSFDLLNSLTERVGTTEPPLALALDGVEDPHNLGAVIRTVECVGGHGVFIPERRSVGLTETVAKVAAGALEYVPVARVTNLARLIEEMKERNIWTVATDADAEIDYTEWDWTVACAVFFGGEGAGLHRLVRERCDASVRIPLRGRISSLNVSVAVGVVLYEALRQRTAKRLVKD